MREEKIKTVVFNPRWFVLKMIFSLVVSYLLVEIMNVEGVWNWIGGFLITFLLMYLIGTVFGFAVNASGNYIIEVLFGVY